VIPVTHPVEPVTLPVKCTEGNPRFRKVSGGCLTIG
jgi:hypothetical protein